MKIPPYEQVMQYLTRAGLIIGIVISLTVTIQFATMLVFPDLDRSDFCPDYQALGQANTEAACADLGGVWEQTSHYAKTEVSDARLLQVVPVDARQCTEGNCWQEFEAATQSQKVKQFVLAFGLNVAVFILGAIVLSGPVSIALVWSGVISMLFSLRFIPRDAEMLIVGVSLVVAAVLVSILMKRKQ